MIKMLRFISTLQQEALPSIGAFVNKKAQRSYQFNIGKFFKNARLFQYQRYCIDNSTPIRNDLVPAPARSSILLSNREKYKSRRVSSFRIINAKTDKHLKCKCFNNHVHFE